MPGSQDAGAAELERIQRLLPLTYPVPAPGTHDGLVPADDYALEQELLRNPDNMRTWSAYITHVEETNYRKRPIPDAWLSSAGVEQLGLLSDETQRLALQRIVSIYERAIAQFPTSYRLWYNYLRARSRFVLGDLRGGEEEARKRMIQGSTQLELGPTLLDSRREEEQQQVYERALDGIIGWQEWRSLAAAFERALMWLPTMPRIWLMYLSLFVHPKCTPILSRTHARRTFDRALRTLPGSLHLRIWKVYLRWAELCGSQVALRVWRRYLRVDPSLSERYVALLLHGSVAPCYADGAQNSIEPPAPEDEEDEEEDPGRGRRVLEAAKVLLRLARQALDGKYTSPDEKSPYQLLVEWLELTERHAEQVGLSKEEEEAGAPSGDEGGAEMDTNAPERLHVTRVVQEEGLKRFPDRAGRLWTGLATYWIQRGELDTARDTFEEAMRQVVTVRDFTQIFDAYAETSENVISFMMEELAEEDEDEERPREEREAEIDERMQAFEALMERRPFLVNDVLLRRNPDDVQEWEKRVALHGDDDEQVVATYRRALDTINPRKATANLHQLYIHFAEFYEQGGSAGRAAPGSVDADVVSARKIYERAVKVPYRRVDDLAEVWCSWAEMEIRNSNYDEALQVMNRALAVPRSAKNVSYYDESLPPQSRLFKSLKLWGFYTDLQESLGTVESARRAFNQILELKIASAQTIINFAMFLEEHGYFEDAFKVYERGIELFSYPVAFELWNVYLSKFIKRYGGSKLERARDLFEQALERCPPKFCKPLFLQYGQLEEEHGLMRKAMSIYQRATKAVESADRYEMYLYYVAKAAANYGLAATRPVYEEAIEVLPDRQAALMCMRFAALERKLGEVDRARAIYAHASQFCNPKTSPEFWSEWNSFEIETGTEDTFREMLRIKRSVQAQFNTDAAYVSASAISQAAKIADGTPAPPSDPMAQAEAARAAAPEAAPSAPARTSMGGPSFVAASKVSQPAQAAQNTEQVGGEGDEDLM